MANRPRKGPTIEAIVINSWTWIVDPDYEPIKITGKYLFFSPDRDRLIEIARQEIRSNGFHAAKVPNEGKNVGPDYVLCLYDEDSGRQHELADRYRNVEGVQYRYWKSDRNTRDGRYSKEFLDQIRKKLSKSRGRNLGF